MFTKGSRHSQFIRRIATLVCFIAVIHSPRAAESDGIKQPGLQRHIIGGRIPQPNAWPWLAALVQTQVDDSSQAQFCGASLIHPWWVLTATHCLTDENVHSFQVVFGAHDFDAPIESQIRTINVAEVFLHPAYETGFDPSIDGDIALIRLAEPIYDIPLLPLAHDDQSSQPGTLATVAGWGVFEPEGEPSQILREVQFPIVSLATAEATEAYDQVLTPDMLAAGVPEGGKDSCQGDSGGPLMVPTASAPGWAQVGIVSFGPDLPCAAPNAYGIYSRVSYYYDDIMTTIHPTFAQWLSNHRIRGIATDPDRDGRSNFQEYAMGSHPLQPDPNTPITLHIEDGNPTFQYVQQVGLTDAELVPELSTDLQNWQPIAPATLTRQPVPGTNPPQEQVTIRPPSETPGPPPARFLRLRTQSAQDLPLPVFANGAIRNLGSLSAPSNTHREFILAGAPVDTEVGLQMVATSGTLIPRLRLLNHTTGELLQQAQAEDGGPEVRLVFTPGQGILYRAVIDSASANAEGTYKFNFPPIEEIVPSEDLIIAPGQTLAGELTEEDDLGEGDFWDDYLLVEYTPGEIVRIEVSSNPNEGGFFPLITVFDVTKEEFVVDSPLEELTKTNVSFRPNDTSEYLISVTNLSIGQSGSYEIAVTQQEN